MSGRARNWMRALVSPQVYANSVERHGVLWCDALLEGQPVRYIGVVQDVNNPFPRARQGEVGLLQGWTLAACVREVLEGSSDGRRGVVSLVDVPSQAYGGREEALCISLALAAAVDAYASVRLAGHATVALLVGKAFSGAFLAHGYQASRLLALDVPQVQVQAMGKESAAKITRRSLAELEEATSAIIPMAYDLQSFARLGILDEVIPCSDAACPDAADVARVTERLSQALLAAESDGVHLRPRLDRGGTGECRELSRRVRQTMEEGWLVPEPLVP